jgi:hypothetical protein
MDDGSDHYQGQQQPELFVYFSHIISDSHKGVPARFTQLFFWRKLAQPSYGGAKMPPLKITEVIDRLGLLVCGHLARG